MSIAYPQNDHPILSLAVDKPSPFNKNDQTKLQLLIEEFDKRLIDEDAYRKRLLTCLQQTAKKAEQLNQFPKSNMLAMVMSENPAIVEYQKALCQSDYQIHKSMTDEISIAVRETQYRIDWIRMVRARAKQCLVHQEKASE